MVEVLIELGADLHDVGGAGDGGRVGQVGSGGGGQAVAKSADALNHVVREEDLEPVALELVGGAD